MCRDRTWASRSSTSTARSRACAPPLMAIRSRAPCASPVCLLTRAYGRHVSFLYSRARATVSNRGWIAFLAFVFGDYCAQVIGASGTATTNALAVACVIVLTILNIVGLRLSAQLQNAMTLAL